MKIAKNTAHNVFVLFAIAAFCGQLNAQELRVWKSAAGKSLYEAEYLTQTDQEVLLRRNDGFIARFSKNLLSDEDQKYLASLPRPILPYVKIALGSSVRFAYRQTTLAYEKKQAQIANQRLLLLEPPLLFAGGANYIAAREIRRAQHRQAQKEKVILSDQEIDQLRTQLLSPSPIPKFNKELEFNPGWKILDNAQLSEDGQYLAALLYGNPPVIEVWELNTQKVTAKIVLNDGSRV